MILNFENIYHFFSFFVTFLFSFYLLLNKDKEYSGNIYIGFFVMFWGFGNLDALLSKASFYPENPIFYLWLASVSFLFYPLIFFYIRSVAFKGYKLKWYDSLHTGLFILFIIVTIFEYHIKPFDVQLIIMSSTDGFYKWFLPSVYILLHVQALTYLILSIQVVLRFKKIVKENYSSINKRNYKWILQLTYVFVYIVVSGLVLNVLRFGVDKAYEDKLLYIFAPINIAFLIWLIYKALSQPQLFNGIDANIKLLKEYLKEKEQQSKTSEQTTLDENLISQDSALKLKLESFMDVEEPFLIPSLSIFELAKGLNLSTMELSIFLNKHLNRNFFDFVNEYRVRKAMEILKDPAKKEITVLEILYEVGFNSKSSFNTVFKKQTELTPSQYRKKHLKSLD